MSISSHKSHGRAWETKSNFTYFWLEEVVHYELMLLLSEKREEENV